jgi:ribose transport system permease protein
MSRRKSAGRNVAVNAQKLFRYLNQEKIVFILTVLLFIAFSVALPNFLDRDNILSLVRSVAVLGILGLGMLIVVLGRGIDLSLVAIMAISVAWSMQLIHEGMSVYAALTTGLLFALGVALCTGILVAYAEIPPLFATLAMATFVYGFGRAHLIVGTDVVYMPKTMGWIIQLGQGKLLGIPMPIVVAGVVAIVVFLFLKYTKIGNFVYAIGDNLAASRISGISVRPMLVLQYVLSGGIAFVAGIITATSVEAMNTRIVNSNMIYDVILVVVLGGVGLSGGRGNVRNVIVGTLLIGVLMNGMTIMDIQYTVQNVIKSLILLFAIVIDSVVNPRDEQTGQQGDI